LRAKIRKELLDIIQRKNLVDEHFIFYLTSILGIKEDRVLDILLMFSGKAIRFPSSGSLRREHRNDLIGRTLDECDSRKVRKKLRERWSLSSANLCMIYKKYKTDIESGEYLTEKRSLEKDIANIEKRKLKGEITEYEANKAQRPLWILMTQIEKDMNFCLRLQAVTSQNSIGLESEDADIFSKALSRIRRKNSDLESGKVRKFLRHDKRFFKFD